MILIGVLACGDDLPVAIEVKSVTPNSTTSGRGRSNTAEKDDPISTTQHHQLHSAPPEDNCDLGPAKSFHLVKSFHGQKLPPRAR
jgi:hypothetical protein